MALSSRELLLIVRAQNQASAALRRVAGDMRALGKIQDLQLRRQQLAINQSQIARQRERAARELSSIQTGARALSVQRTRLNNMIREEDLTRRLAAAETARASVQGRLGAAARRLKAATDPGDIAQARNNVELLTRAFEAQQFKVAQLRRRMESLNISKQHLAARSREMGLRANEVSHELSTLAQREALLARKQQDLNKIIRQARWERFAILGRTMSHFGRVTQLAGLVSGAALGYAANAAADFETRVRLVATQTGRIGTGFQQVVKNANVLRQGILRVMQDSTSSTEELTQAAYDLFSSLDFKPGMRGLKEGTRLLKLMSNAAIAGQTDVATATDGTISVMNAFGFTAREMPRVLQRMFAAVRFGRMTFGEFAKTLSTTAPAAKAAGQSFDTLTGTMAFLTRRLDVNKAAVGFARLTEILGRKKFVDNLKEAGVAITDTSGRMLQMPEVIGRIVREFPKLKTGGTFLANFFKEMSGTEGTIQARRAFVFLAQQLGQYRDLLGRTVRDNNEFNRSLRAMSQTAGVRWEKAINRIRVLFLELGAAAIPTILEMMKPIERLVKWFSNLDEATKRNIGRFAVWTAAVLLIGGTLLTVGGSILAFIAILGKFGMIMKGGTAIVLAAIAAIRIFQGEWRSLGDAISGIGDIFFGTWQGFIAGSILAVAAIKRVAAALAGLRIAMAMGGGATAATAAGGGFLPMLFGRGRDMKAGLGLVRESARQGSRLGGIFRAAGTAAMLLPGPLKIAATAMAALGVGALIFKRHQDAARESAERMAQAIQSARHIAQAPARMAPDIGAVGLATTDAKRAALNLKTIEVAIRRVRTALREAKGEERVDLQLQLRGLTLDRVDALSALNTAQNQVIRGTSAFNTALSRQAYNLQQIGERREAIRNIEEFLKTIDKARRMPEVGRRRLADSLGLDTTDVSTLKERLQTLRAQLKEFEAGTAASSVAVSRNFSKMVRDFQRLGTLPKAPQAAIENVLKFAERIGRMPTLKQMRIILKAGVEPDIASMKKLPALIQNFFARQRLKEVRLDVKAKINLIRATKADVGMVRGKIPGLGNLTQDLTANLSVKAKTDAAMGQINKTVAHANKVRTMPIKADTAAAYNSISALRAYAGRPITLSVNVSRTETITRINKELGKPRSPFPVLQKYLSKHAPTLPIKIQRAKVLLRKFDPTIRDLERELAKLVAKMRKTRGKELKELMQEIKEKKRDIKKAYVQAYKEMVNAGAQFLLDRRNEIRDQVADIFGAIGEGLDFAESAQDIKDKMKQAFGDLFSGQWLSSETVRMREEWGQALTPEDLLKDLRAQLDAFKKLGQEPCRPWSKRSA